MTPEQIAQMTNTYTPASLNSPIGLHAMELGQPAYTERPESLAKQLSRSNSMKKAKKLSIRTPHSARTSLGSAYDAASSAYSTGHGTPDSITTSGAVTPYAYHHESRSNQISPDGPFTRSLGLNGVSRTPTSSHYSNGSLPHIVGQTNGRGQETDWANFHSYNSTDDYGHAPYHSGTSTPHHPIKSEPEFPHQWDWSLFNKT